MFYIQIRNQGYGRHRRRYPRRGKCVNVYSTIELRVHESAQMGIG